MKARAPWLLGQALWALGITAWAIFSVVHRPRIAMVINLVYFLALAVTSVAAWSGRVWAVRLIPAQLAGLVAILCFWVAVQIREYVFGTLYVDSPATMIVVGVTVCVTLVPSALFLAMSLRRRDVQRPAA